MLRLNFNRKLIISILYLSDFFLIIFYQNIIFLFLDIIKLKNLNQKISIKNAKCSYIYVI